MPRKFLASLDTGETFDFSAGDRNTGKVNVAFGDDAGEHDQATIIVTTADGAQRRKDKLRAGTTRVASAGLHHDMTSIENVGPSQVEVSLSW